MAKTPSIILGISQGHGDSSAALIVDGVLVAAAEEERFARLKHYALYPERAIAYCLSHADVDPGAVEAVAVARKPWSSFLQRLLLGLRHPHLRRASGRRKIGEASVQQPLRRMLRQAGLKRARLYRVEHHFAHLMSARWLVEADRVALLSLDGLGDFASASLGLASGPHSTLLKRVFFPHSIGFFYTAMTQYLGFPHFGDEYKVMGLASYGKPRHLPALRDLLRARKNFGYDLNLEAFPLLKVPIEFYLEKGQPKLKPFYNRSLLTQILGLAPRKFTEPLTEAHHDLAASVQARFEEVANHLVSCAEKLKADALALAGGCAHNSVWVGKILQNSSFRKIAVAPAAGDAGIAAGAAIAVSGAAVRPEGGHWALLGPDAGHVPWQGQVPAHVSERSFLDEESLIAWMVRELTEGKIIGLARGRMEFGPRALGHRSILADPRHSDMRDRLNARVKHREPFRPFAASVLWEHQEKWFKGSFFCPSMEAVFVVEEQVRQRIPAVVHVDNTCRIQSVRRDTQPFFWHLIEAFRRATGVPMLVNTSFNDSEPIVCTERDAYQCFLGTDLDHLVLGSKAYSKSQKAMALSA